MKASAAAGAALILVALGGGNGAAADQGSAAPAGESGSIQPGQWEMTSQATSLEFPGAPSEVQAQLRAQLNRPQTQRTCITPEQGANPLQGLRRELARSQPGMTCQTPDDTFSGGVIRLRATCQGPVDTLVRMQLAFEGRFTATTIDATFSMDQTVGPAECLAPQSLRMTSIMRARRIGECPAAAVPAREN